MRCSSRANQQIQIDLGGKARLLDLKHLLRNH